MSELNSWPHEISRREIVGPICRWIWWLFSVLITYRSEYVYINVVLISCLILTHPLCRSVIEGGHVVSLALTANWLLGLHIPVMWDLCRVPSYLWDFKSPAPLKYCFSCDPRSSYLSKSWIILVIVVILIADKTCLLLIEGLDGWFCRCIIDPGIEWK